MAHPLAGAKLRLERAQWHIDELNGAFRAYLADLPVEHHPEFQDSPYRDEVKGDRRERSYAPWKIQIVENPISKSLPILVGEAIQNMRAALDYLVYELALWNLAGKRLRIKTQFPIATTAASYFKTGRHQVGPLLGEHRRRIRKLQPYQSDGDVNAHPLAVLNRLSNADKHRLLLAVVYQPTAIVLNMRQGWPITGPAVAIPSHERDSEYVQEINRRNPNLGALLPFTIGLGDVGNADVFETLDTLLLVVKNILDGFGPVLGKK